MTLAHAPSPLNRTRRFMATTRSARRNAERYGKNVAAREAVTETVAQKAEPKRDGLEWLRRKDYISDDEYLAGRWYANVYRWANMEGAVPIASFLGRSEVSGRSGSHSSIGASEDKEIACRIVAARNAMRDIDLNLGWDTEVRAVLFAVCVQGVRISDMAMTHPEKYMTAGALRRTLAQLAVARKKVGKATDWRL